MFGTEPLLDGTAVLSVALPAGNADRFLAALQHRGAAKWAVTQRSDTTDTAVRCDLEEAHFRQNLFTTLVWQFYTDAVVLEPANPLWQARLNRC